MSKHAIALAALLLTASPTWAINKCINVDGKPVFQDTPCAEGRGGKIEVKPAAGRAPVAAAKAANASDALPQSEAARLNASVAASQKERRRLSLERLGVPEASAAVFSHRKACEAKQAQLEADKERWVQNLWGKTNSAQRASEQATAAARCDTRDRQLVNNYNTLLKECQELSGCGGYSSM